MSRYRINFRDAAISDRGSVPSAFSHGSTVAQHYVTWDAADPGWEAESQCPGSADGGWQAGSERRVGRSWRRRRYPARLGSRGAQQTSPRYRRGCPGRCSADAMGESDSGRASESHGAAEAAFCLPAGLPADMLRASFPFKIVQTPSVTIILLEEFNNWRQIATDGRALPPIEKAAWYGTRSGGGTATCSSSTRLGSTIKRGWTTAALRTLRACV